MAWLIPLLVKTLTWHVSIGGYKKEEHLVYCSQLSMEK